jgi:hypothetical protein
VPECAASVFPPARVAAEGLDSRRDIDRRLVRLAGPEEAGRIANSRNDETVMMVHACFVPPATAG